MTKEGKDVLMGKGVQKHCLQTGKEAVIFRWDIQPNIYWLNMYVCIIWQYCA